MHNGLNNPIEKLITRIFSFWVRPDVVPQSPEQLLDPTIPVLFVLETGGLADRAALNLICDKYNLPKPSSTLIYGQISEANSVDLLKHRRGIFFRQHRLVKSLKLTRLVQERIENEPGELQIVPIAVYWGRAPDKEDSVWSLFFSENWQVAGRTRKLITTLVYGRDTLLSISEPLSLNALIESETSTSKSTSTSPELLQRKLSRILRVHFRQRRIASLGPDQSHRRNLVNHVMADPGVRAAINETATKEKKKLDRIESRANHYALEIAADVSYPTVRVLHRGMNRLWTELYDGVEVSGLDRLKSISDGRELVYVPCHRSHIDYLLLSYILYINGYSLPHIAAGINLNLPIIGGLLRRGGAFFLRRSFAGNKLYAAVFNAYLKEILQRGNALEYFIEGGRSRTGRSLPPKGGMLAMTAHAYLRNPRTPVAFIPVYFGYERLIEGRAFTNELTGGKKQKETVFALIKSLKSLREEYGNVYVNFGNPIELDNLLDQHNKNWRSETIALERPEWLTPVIDELGNNIMQNINDAACVTPISLLATGMLSTRHGSLGKPELIEQMRLYLLLFKAAVSGTTAVVPDINFDDAIAHGIKLGFIETNDDSLGTLISIKPGNAAPLTYFRNNVQHLIIVPALIASCFNSARKRTKEELERLVKYAYPFLQSELYLSAVSPEKALNETLRSLTTNKLLTTEDETCYQRAHAGSAEAQTLTRLSESVTPALERYFLAASIISHAGERGLSAETLAERCEACAARLAMTQGRDIGDLYDKHLHTAMMKTLAHTEYVQIDDTVITASEKLLNLAGEARTLVSEQMRHAIVRAVSQLQ